MARRKHPPYEVFATLPIEYAEDRLEEPFEGIKIKPTIQNQVVLKNPKCEKCKVYFTQARIERAWGTMNPWHWNFYSSDGRQAQCHHKIPRAKKGPTKPYNLAVLCESCHKKLHRR